MQPLGVAVVAVIVWPFARALYEQFGSIGPRFFLYGQSFWRLTGRDQQRPEAFARHFEAGQDALRILDGYLTGRKFLVGGSYTVADVALYAYTHVAHEAGIDMAAYPAIGPWLARVEATDRFANDLEPYPENARVPARG